MADHDLLAALVETDETAAMGERLRDRDLYKRAVWAELDAVPGDLIGCSFEEARELEREIAQQAEVDPGDVILDVPRFPPRLFVPARRT